MTIPKQKRTTMILVALAVMSVAVAKPVIADMFRPSHSCFKPTKPYSFESQWEIDNWYDEVERYKRCIENFIDQQEEAIEQHQDAASDAVDDWNTFVRFELD